MSIPLMRINNILKGRLWSDLGITMEYPRTSAELMACRWRKRIESSLSQRASQLEHDTLAGSLKVCQSKNSSQFLIG